MNACFMMVLIEMERTKTHTHTNKVHENPKKQAIYCCIPVGFLLEISRFAEAKREKKAQRLKCLFVYHFHLRLYYPVLQTRSTLRLFHSIARKQRQKRHKYTYTYKCSYITSGFCCRGSRANFLEVNVDRFTSTHRQKVKLGNWDGYGLTICQLDGILLTRTEIRARAPRHSIHFGLK